MLRGYWIAAIAFGLILPLADVGNGQEDQTSDGTQSAQTGAQQAEPLLPSIGIRIIESDEQAGARQATEERAEQRELDDLAAQQGMNEATQKMALYALLQTILIAIGTCALIYTLHLTRQANRAAQSGVAVTRYIGKVQSEAYLAVSDLSIGGGAEHNIYRETVETGFAIIGASFVNTGQSPAVIQSAEMRIEIARGGNVLHEGDLPTAIEQSTVEAGGNGFVSAKFPYRFLVEEGFHEMHGASITVRGSVDYKTRFGDIDRIRYEVTKAIVSTRPINPEIQVGFQNDPLTPPRVEVERIEKSKAHYEEG
jgi:hypothetical protein